MARDIICIHGNMSIACAYVTHTKYKIPKFSMAHVDVEMEGEGGTGEGVGEGAEGGGGVRGEGVCGRCCGDRTHTSSISLDKSFDCTNYPQNCCARVHIKLLL